jgi:hypothetical protein
MNHIPTNVSSLHFSPYAKLSEQKLDELPTFLLVYHVFSYLKIDSLLSLSSSSKSLRHMIFSKQACDLWNNSKIKHQPFEICIDSYCPLCLLTKRIGCHESALNILSTLPLKNIRMHCFITDIPSCLESIACVEHIERLDLRLSNKSYSPNLRALLQSSDYLMSIKNHSTEQFRNLRELVLDSSYLNHVLCGGRELLLEILGRHLTSLKFVGLSPFGVFHIVSTRCPNLRSLRIDRAESQEDLISYYNPFLTSLELCRANYALSPLNLPALTHLRYSPSFRFEPSQMESVIQAIPASIRYLHLEIPSSYASATILGISRRLPQLESLTLEGSFENGTISEDSLIQLGAKCPKLSRLELISSKSVTVISLEPLSFIQLRSLPALRSLRVMYQDSVLLFLPNLLRQHEALKEIILWHRRHWFDAIHWAELEAILISTRSMFPSVHIALEEYESSV